MGDEPRKNDGLIVWVTYPDGKNVMKCGLIIMGDLPGWKKCDMTSVKKIGLTWQSSEGMTEERAGKLGAS